jgi:hypothetical protein
VLFDDAQEKEIEALKLRIEKLEKR